MWASWGCGVGSQTPRGAWLLKNAVSTASLTLPAMRPARASQPRGSPLPCAFFPHPAPRAKVKDTGLLRLDFVSTTAGEVWVGFCRVSTQ